MASSRKFDVVVFGASGFTGKFVVKHLVNLKSTNAEKFTFAIAGRSISKLQGNFSTNRRVYVHPLMLVAS